MLIRLALSLLTSRASLSFGKLGMFEDPDPRKIPLVPLQSPYCMEEC